MERMNKLKRIAVCPGSFDPITFGHIDIIKRASQLFDEVVVLSSVNTVKSPSFTESERYRTVSGRRPCNACFSVRSVRGRGDRRGRRKNGYASSPCYRTC